MGLEGPLSCVLCQCRRRVRQAFYFSGTDSANPAWKTFVEEAAECGLKECFLCLGTAEPCKSKRGLTAPRRLAESYGRHSTVLMAFHCS